MEYRAHRAEMTPQGELLYKGLAYSTPADFIKACGAPLGVDGWECVTYHVCPALHSQHGVDEVWGG